MTASPQLFAALFAALIFLGPFAVHADETDKEPAGIYCKLSSDDLRERLGAVRADFVGAIIGVDEVETGYRYWFDKSPEQLRKLADFVHFESECCPFLDFEISLASEAKRVALSLTGPDGTKDFLASFAETAAFDLKTALAASKER